MSRFSETFQALVFQAALGLILVCIVCNKFYIHKKSQKLHKLICMNAAAISLSRYNVIVTQRKDWINYYGLLFSLTVFKPACVCVVYWRWGKRSYVQAYLFLLVAVFSYTKPYRNSCSLSGHVPSSFWSTILQIAEDTEVNHPTYYQLM